jgi:hypothetical protein
MMALIALSLFYHRKYSLKHTFLLPIVHTRPSGGEKKWRMKGCQFAQYTTVTVTSILYFM